MQPKSLVWSIRFLLLIAGLGGLLYGIDVGIIAGALPYLQSTARHSWNLSDQQISFVVAAVLLGSVLSSLFAGMLAELMGRRRVMVLSGLLFVASIPMIALAGGYMPLLLGRLLQGISGGLIGVVVPLYLAESLPAASRGKGTAIFQWLLTLGLVLAAVIGLYCAHSVEQAADAARGTAQADALVLAAEDHAWRNIFWMSIIPGVMFTAGSLLLWESSRWLFRLGRKDAARASLLRTRTPAEADVELGEMESIAAGAEKTIDRPRDSLLSRKYVLPFFIACVILACMQATGVNSILAYVVNILNQAGLPGSIANWGDVSVKVLNCLITVVAVILVDRKGRKFLMILGTSGIIVCLAAAGLLFLSAERGRSDCTAAVQAMARGDALRITVDERLTTKLAGNSASNAPGRPMQLTLSYAYGPFSDVQSRRTDDVVRLPIQIDRQSVVTDDGALGKLFRTLHLNPFADPAAGQSAPLRIKKALLGPVPESAHGWLVAIFLLGFIAFFAVGPGVCGWLALTELMPTRIRSNGMSIAVVLNQCVSTTIAAIFLPTVGDYGYAAMFFFWSGCTVVFFLTVVFLLPETKGKTLEEIEELFTRHQPAHEGGRL